VDPRGEALLPQRADYPGGEQEGPAQRRAHAPRARQDEAGQWGRLALPTILFKPAGLLRRLEGDAANEAGVTEPRWR